MSMGDARYGRRDNGLVAAQYADAGDVDPRVGEHLLDVLALAGIAAYLRPSSDQNPLTRSTVLPKRPIDRLFVDRDHLATARTYLVQLDGSQGADRTVGSSLVEDRTVTTADDAAGVERATTTRPEDPASAEFDRAWAQIVAGFGETAPGHELPSPEPDRDAWPTQPYGLRLTRPTPEPSLLDGLDTFGAGLPEEDEGEFVRPEAPPVPRPSLPAVLAVIGIVGGLAVFLKPDLLAFLTRDLSMTVGFLAVIAGFGTLVYRLRPGRDEDDDTDDGARV